MKINKQDHYEQINYEQVHTALSAQLNLEGEHKGQRLVPYIDLHRAIRLPEVLRLTGLSRSTWYGLLNPRLPSHDPQAPRPFKLGNTAGCLSVWWVWEVLAYLQSKSNASRVH